MKIAVYTALFTNRNISSLLKIPKKMNGYYDFIPFIGHGSRIDARCIKCLPHKYLPEYDISMWIDGCIQITDDIIPIIEKYLKDVNMVVLSHPGEHRKLAIYEEAERCKAFNKGDPTRIDKQVSFYKKSGCPDTQEVIATTIMIRRHNEPEIIRFDETWWQHINYFSIRDQISFPFLAWTLKLKYNKIYSTHEETKRLGVMGTYWFQKNYKDKMEV